MQWVWKGTIFRIPQPTPQGIHHKNDKSASTELTLLLVNQTTISTTRTPSHGRTSARSQRTVAYSTVSSLRDANGTTPLQHLESLILRSCLWIFLSSILFQFLRELSQRLAFTSALFTRFWAEPELCRQQVIPPTSWCGSSCHPWREKTKTSGSKQELPHSYHLNIERVYMMNK